MRRLPLSIQHKEARVDADLLAAARVARSPRHPVAPRLMNRRACHRRRRRRRRRRRGCDARSVRDAPRSAARGSDDDGAARDEHVAHRRRRRPPRRRRRRRRRRTPTPPPRPWRRCEIWRRRRGGRAARAAASRQRRVSFGEGEAAGVADAASSNARGGLRSLGHQGLEAAGGGAGAGRPLSGRVPTQRSTSPRWWTPISAGATRGIFADVERPLTASPIVVRGEAYHRRPAGVDDRMPARSSACGAGEVHFRPSRRRRRRDAPQVRSPRWRVSCTRCRKSGSAHPTSSGRSSPGPRRRRRVADARAPLPPAAKPASRAMRARRRLRRGWAAWIAVDARRWARSRRAADRHRRRGSVAARSPKRSRIVSASRAAADGERGRRAALGRSGLRVAALIRLGERVQRAREAEATRRRLIEPGTKRTSVSGPLVASKPRRQDPRSAPRRRRRESRLTKPDRRSAVDARGITPCIRRRMCRGRAHEQAPTRQR